MTKKIKSTYDELIESMSTQERKGYDAELKDLLLSEFILALIEQDGVSVRKLAKLSGISRIVFQAMCSGL